MKISENMFGALRGYMAKDKNIPEGWIYIGNDRERYLLGQPGKNNLLVFGVNPSTATAGHDDPTIRKVRKITEAAGYDGWIMVNLYPQIAANPEDLHVKADRTLSSNNMKVLKAVSSQFQIGAVWAAWGNLIDKRFFLGEELIKILDMLDGDYEWYRWGRATKSGNPRHPLYLRQDDKLEYFPVGDYGTAWLNDV